MPMSFPDMQSLRNRAELQGFRQPQDGESEEQYREAFADYMLNVDQVESAEIRTGKGWDQMDPMTLLMNTVGQGRNRNVSTSARGQTAHITPVDEAPFYPSDT